MAMRILSLALGLSLCLTGSAAVASGVFKANRLFVCSAGSSRIEMFEKGAAVGTPLGGALNLPVVMTFGPDGFLYVIESTDNEVTKFDADGNLVASFGASFIDGTGLMTFGADGRLYVVSLNNRKLLMFNTAGVKVGEIDLSADMTVPAGIAIGPDGHIYIGDWNDGVIDEYDPSGLHLRELGSNLGQPVGMRFGPNGRLYVACQISASIRVLDELGAQVDQIGAGSTLSFPYDCTFGPDGHLWVTCQDTDQVFAFDLAGNQLTGIPPSAGLDQPTGIAFAPFHFKAKVSGRLVMNGTGTSNIRENVHLYVAPGSGLLMMEIDYLPGPYALSEFGSQYYVLHGFESYKGVLSGKRIFTGRQQTMHGFRNGGASASLTVKGKMSGAGLFIPKSANGSFQREAHNGSFNGKIVATRLLQ